MAKSSVKKISEVISATNAKQHSLIPIEIAVGMLLSIASFVLFVSFADEVLEKEGIYLDIIISKLIYAFRTPLLTEFMQIISFLGGEVLVLVSAGIVLYLISRKYKREAGLFALTIIMGYILNSLIKYLLKIPRPTIDPLTTALFYSFPSGHAMNSFIFYASVSYFTFHFTRNKVLSIIVSLVSSMLILLIGFSRIYLGVHYPSDVLAGFVAGFWWFITVIVIDKTLHAYRLLKHTKK